MLDPGLQGKIALAAEELAREGAKVLVVARGQEAIDEMVAALRASGGTAEGRSADMTDPAAIVGGIERCPRRMGGDPDIAVVNSVALRGSASTLPRPKTSPRAMNFPC